MESTATVLPTRRKDGNSGNAVFALFAASGLQDHGARRAIEQADSHPCLKPGVRAGAFGDLFRVALSPRSESKRVQCCCKGATASRTSFSPLSTLPA
jgi:hypothetical protein